MATKPIKDKLTEDIEQAKEKKGLTDAQVSQQFNMAEKARRDLVRVYKAEEKVMMYLSPAYKPYLGSVLQVMVNGITIAFPVDGQAYEIPKTFADEIVRRRTAIDAIMTKTSNMANVSNNFEQEPGGLKLF